MEIKEPMIAKKEIVGKTNDGNPIVMVVTHGGLYAFFAKKGKEVITLGMAPHRAIAAWMSEKKDKDIQWNEGFLKSEGNDFEELKKSKQDLFIKLRSAMFAPIISSELIKHESAILSKTNYYLIYDVNQAQIGIMHKDEIVESILSKNIKRDCIVRRIDLTESPSTIKYHKDFQNVG